MSLSSKVNVSTHDVSLLKKLIKLNTKDIGHTYGSNVSFTASGLSPFQFLIIDENTLNTIEESKLQYKQVASSISGEITVHADQDVEYYILLKSEKPTKVKIELVYSPLPPPPVAPSTPVSPQVQTETNYQLYFILGIVVVCVAFLVVNNRTKLGAKSFVPNLSVLDKLKQMHN